MLLEFYEEFETLYCQCRTDRLHFVHHAIHQVGHLAHEFVRTGPPGYSTQWPMERTIGSLGAEIRQPSKPYANLARRALRRCQANVIKAMVPDLDPAPPLPRGAVDLGDNYILLRASEDHEHAVDAQEAEAISSFIRNSPTAASFATPDFMAQPKVAKWARLRLPNGQVGRSLWKEHEGSPRTARNMKVTTSPS